MLLCKATLQLHYHPELYCRFYPLVFEPVCNSDQMQSIFYNRLLCMQDLIRKQQVLCLLGYENLYNREFCHLAPLHMTLCVPRQVKPFSHALHDLLPPERGNFIPWALFS